MSDPKLKTSENDVVQIDETNIRQKQAFQLVKSTNQTFFLTGRAGTGKTTFLKNIQKLTDKKFVVLAPTGIAALVAGGMTIHSFFGMSLDVISPNDYGRKLNPNRINVIKECDTIIIDEVSMVSCDKVDFIDRKLRQIMLTDQPFGGKQIIFSGDMFQLPPVLKQGADTEAMLDYYGTDRPYFFKAKVFKKISPLLTIEFVKVYRQEDQQFVDILNNIRYGVYRAQDVDKLNSRCVSADVSKPIIALTPHKNTAKEINCNRLSDIKSKEFCYTGIISGSLDHKKILKEDMPSPYYLKLKVGAQVMFTRNDPAHRWVNGTIGTVNFLSDDKILVNVDGAEIPVTPMKWEYCEYKFDKESRKLSKNIVGSYEQYPLQTAWAITIHKSQGLTFDRMVLDLSKTVFAPGQLYVALSRVKSLDGLYLTTQIRPADVKKDDEIQLFVSGFNNDDLINAKMKEGMAVYPYLKSKDYDGAITKYMELAINDIHNGDNRAASLLFKKMFDIMRFDDVLYKNVKPCDINTSDNQIAYFNNAVISLYSGKYEDAIKYADKVLSVRPVLEAMYIKARAYTHMKNYQKADAINSEMDAVLENENKTPDIKFFHSYAVVNAQIGDPYLNAYQYIVDHEKLYLPAHIAYAKAMIKENKQLVMSDDYELPLLAKLLNNRDLSKFTSELQLAVNDNPTELDKYMEVVRNQLL